MPPKLMTLREIILIHRNTSLDEFFLQEDYPWSLDSLGVVYAYEDGDDFNIDHPEFIKQHNLTPVFPVGDMYQVLNNLQLQKSQVTFEEAVAGLNHYYRHDGFLVLPDADL